MREKVDREPQVMPYSMRQPYVSSHTEFMKIEMKSLRRNISRDSSKLKADLRCGDAETHDRQLPQVSKLPSLPDLETEEATTKLSITVTKSKTPRQQGHIGQSEPDRNESAAQHPPETCDKNSPSIVASSGGVAPNNTSLLSVASLGGSRGVGRMATARNRHLSSEKGRLSQGWSPPQPIEPLKGSPIHRRVGGTNTAEVKDKSALSPTASMMIAVNVNEFLTDRN